MTTKLESTDQFVIMRKKMITSITKIMNTNINLYQAHVYFNIYMLKSIFFSCAVVHLINKQIAELKRIYKVPLLRKLQLSTRFPKELLYIWKSWLGVGLLAPEIVLAILKLKVYIRYKRVKRNITKFIKIHKDLVDNESRLTTS